MTVQPIPPLDPQQAGAAQGAQSVTSWLIAVGSSAKGFATRHRTAILIAALVFFVAGLAFSAQRLSLSIADIEPLFILLSAILFVPAAILYGAFNFMVMAKGAGHDVPFMRALKVSSIAAFAEFLPLPGGALVRGGAMMREGSKAGEAGAHVIVNALLWVACAALVAAIVLGSSMVAQVIGACGLIGIIGCSLWLAQKASPLIATAAFTMRIFGLVIAGARIFAAFMAIGFLTNFVDIYPFVFASILGSAAAIVPGGLGISEALAAAISALSAIPAEAAFLAVALNRLIGFAVSGIATGIIVFFFGSDLKQTNTQS